MRVWVCGGGKRGGWVLLRVWVERRDWRWLLGGEEGGGGDAILRFRDSGVRRRIVIYA